MLAKSLAIDIDQTSAVFGFLGLHFLKHRDGGRISFSQPIGKVAVDAAVLFLQADGQRQNFFL
jgi:hypothetical protein